MTLIGYNFTFQMICDADCLVSNSEAIYERLSQGKPHILFVL